MMGMYALFLLEAVIGTAFGLLREHLFRDCCRTKNWTSPVPRFLLFPRPDRVLNKLHDRQVIGRIDRQGDNISN